MRLLFSASKRTTLGRAAGLALLTCLTACSSALPFLSSADKTSVYATPTSTGDTSGAQVIAPTGFAKLLSYVSPYRVPIQQGNFVSQEMISQLKEGMTREQVRFLLGTALLTDMFHEDRWDYPFRLTKGNGEQITSRVSVYFKNNTVAKFEGGNLPTEKDYLARITESALGVNRVQSVIDTDGPAKKKEK
ncbi:outer membrane protein assembly factor BamE [Undibacterium sp. CY18W]|uniref:Outer membrane protein assembly factor BamE n=1 Tax=Undibacterium hunanense TaxID=2762292 RepID=A0ABR6ZPG8_9BURK|nr:outer membrane protein assembly factor BamE [Undibacterium hunanense]MBC3917801.1 outer membrane protein assembly factor BamE [Undibacterium hunanense]